MFRLNVIVGCVLRVSSCIVGCVLRVVFNVIVPCLQYSGSVAFSVSRGLASKGPAQQCGAAIQLSTLCSQRLSLQSPNLIPSPQRSLVNLC
ncbi:unnamed protein product [Gongylonema pulchrum]|uniref:Secreted protein n=1 Tax=Gongylonema pulchrum TaxID=637853 RepID=A0A183DNT5_9BILA|nr:unnamed protein product [Gongylonema pulchrum]